ncbi:MAG: ABC transporter permease [Actinobacteria bacterium]|nr:ABC transporter permease [Actinomycetota bacterium]
MARYILKRILMAIPVIILVSILTFSLMHLAPGDPVQILLGIYSDPVLVQTLQEQLNLDKPIIVQYFLWAGNVLRGDLGVSFRSKTPVISMILERYPRTLLLSGLGLSLSVFFSIIMGVIAASRRNSAIDISVITIAIIGISIPQFVMGILLILFFGVFLKWLPVMGYVPFIQNPLESLRHLILPAFSLGIVEASLTARMTRSEVLEILGQDFIKTARAKGLKEKAVIFKHALKNALVPVVTIIGVQFAFLMGGTVIIEQIFVYPGLGRLIVEAIFNRDYPVVQGVILFTSTVFIFINIVVDITYTVLNPKVRLE